MEYLHYIWLNLMVNVGKCTMDPMGHQLTSLLNPMSERYYASPFFPILKMTKDVFLQAFVLMLQYILIKLMHLQRTFGPVRHFVHLKILPLGTNA